MIGDVGAGVVDGGGAGVRQEVVILGRDDAAADDEDVAGALLLGCCGQMRDQGFVAGGGAGDADDVDVVSGGLVPRPCVAQVAVTSG